MKTSRIRQLNSYTCSIKGPVVYWMGREHRTKDNWTLLHAQKKALHHKVPLVVLFCFVPDFLQGTSRQYSFMLNGLRDVERTLKSKNIPFFLLEGKPEEEIPKFLDRIHADCLYADFSPLRTIQNWRTRVARKISIPFFEVDAHNIIPCWLLPEMNKNTIGEFRVRVRSLLPDFLKGFPSLQKQKIFFDHNVPVIDWDKFFKSIPLKRNVKEIDWLLPGEREAQKVFRTFLRKKINEYALEKEDIFRENDERWKILVYLHFGQLSIQRVVWAVTNSNIHPQVKAYLLNIFIIRRELAEYFCFNHPKYNTLSVFPKWAQDTIAKHKNDRREYLYSLEQFKNAKTHDALWNAIQMELVLSGKLFGEARKYWVKKIFEWTRSPQRAMSIAATLKELYSLSGWDPSGYFNIARSIGAVYDVPSEEERPVFGFIPYMETGDKKVWEDLKKYSRM